MQGALVLAIFRQNVVKPLYKNVMVEKGKKFSTYRVENKWGMI